MSHPPRTLANAGWADTKSLPKGPTGRLLCRYCGTEVSGRRVTFCSGQRAQFGRLRGNVVVEGHGCVHEHLVRSDPGYARKCCFARDRGECAICGETTAQLCNAWQADHIIPVAEGGGSCGLENLRTLCISCHKRETAALAARRAAARVALKPPRV
jgi:5-methylcytosine-specific restriction endonuclease McrA